MSDKYKLKYIFNFGSIKVTKNCTSGQIIIRRGDKTLKSNLIKSIIQNQEINFNQKLTFCTIMSTSCNATAKKIESSRLIQAASKKKIIEKLQSKQVDIELKLFGIQSKGKGKDETETKKITFDLAKITNENINQKHFYFEMKSVQAMIYCQFNPVISEQQETLKSTQSQQETEKQSNFKSTKNLGGESINSNAFKSTKNTNISYDSQIDKILKTTNSKSVKAIKWDDQQKKNIKQSLNQITNVQNSYTKTNSGIVQRSNVKKPSLKPVSIKCIDIPQQDILQEEQQIVTKVTKKRPIKFNQKENLDQTGCLNCKRLTQQLQQSKAKQMSLMQKIVVSELYVKSPSVKKIQFQSYNQISVNSQGIFSTTNLGSNPNDILQLKLQNQKIKKQYIQMHKQTMQMRKQKQFLIEKSNVYLNDNIKMKEKMMRIVNVIIQNGGSELLSQVTELLN